MFVAYRFPVCSRLASCLRVAIRFTLATGPVSARGKPKLHLSEPKPSAGILCILLLFVLGCGFAQAGPLSITTAVYNHSSQKLTVKTRVKGVSGTLILLHGQGGILGQASTAKTHKFTIRLTQLGEVPCQVEARLGNLSVSKKVAGAPAACGKIPTCKILPPAPGAALKINNDVAFSAEAKLKDKKAEPLTYEWDFAGGSMGEAIPGTSPVAYKRPVAQATTVQFVRDNSSYRVRFAATDAKKRRCESTVDVNVGNPPAAPPGVAAIAEQAIAQAPARGTGLQSDTVVLPVQEWTMQSDSDSKKIPNILNSANTLANNLHAYVLKKGSVGVDGPRFLTGDEINVRYSAASNPVDPAGKDSINSTSQNWPINADPTMFAPLETSQIQKTDQWETFARPVSEVWQGARSVGYLQAVTEGPSALTYSDGLPKPDEGYFPHITLQAYQYYYDLLTPPDQQDNVLWGWPIDAAFWDYNDNYWVPSVYNRDKDAVDQFTAKLPQGLVNGSYMPGVDNE